MCKKSLEPLVKPKGSQTKKNSWNETKELRNQLEEKTGAVCTSVRRKITME